MEQSLQMPPTRVAIPQPGRTTRVMTHPRNTLDTISQGTPREDNQGTLGSQGTSNSMGS